MHKINLQINKNKNKRIKLKLKQIKKIKRPEKIRKKLYLFK